MNITKTQNEDKIVLGLSGRLDTLTAPQLQAALMPEFDTAKEIELDFSGLTYISSAGLRVLLMGEKTAKAKDTKMTLSHVSPDIMEVFSITGFDAFLHMA